MSAMPLFQQQLVFLVEIVVNVSDLDLCLMIWNVLYIDGESTNTALTMSQLRHNVMDMLDQKFSMY